MLKTLLIAAMAVSAAASANAATITRFVAFGDFGTLVTNDAPVEGTFNFTPSIPNSFIAVDGLFEVTFGDDTNGDNIPDAELETAAFRLDAQDFEVAIDNDTLLEFATSGLNASVFLDLNDDGMIAFRISSPNAGQDFLVFSTQLTVTVEAAPRNVPDGGATAALLGCSFLGLAYVRSRFSALMA